MHPTFAGRTQFLLTFGGRTVEFEKFGAAKSIKSIERLAKKGFEDNFQADIDVTVTEELAVVRYDPAKLVGKNPRPANGRVNTGLPGGERAARSTFRKHAGRGVPRREGDQLVARNGVRLRKGPDGRWRVDIPAKVGRAGVAETIHFSP